MYFRNDNQDPTQKLNEDMNQDLNDPRSHHHSHSHHHGYYHEEMYCPMMYCCPMMYGQQTTPYHTMTSQIMPTATMPISKWDDPDPRYYHPYYHHYYHPYYHHTPWWMYHR